MGTNILEELAAFSFTLGYSEDGGSSFWNVGTQISNCVTMLSDAHCHESFWPLTFCLHLSGLVITQYKCWAAASYHLYVTNINKKEVFVWSCFTLLSCLVCNCTDRDWYRANRQSGTHKRKSWRKGRHSSPAATPNIFWKTNVSTCISCVCACMSAMHRISLFRVQLKLCI